jgi:hypothetical protein
MSTTAAPLEMVHASYMYMISLITETQGRCRGRGATAFPLGVVTSSTVRLPSLRVPDVQNAKQVAEAYPTIVGFLPIP